jgi:3-oxoacyl-[acyl-carrier protein] reductase
MLRMGKVIFITGAGTGIGAETARVMAEGNTLFLHYNVSAEPAKKVAKEVEKLGGKAYLLQADITKEENCIKLVEELKKHTDYLDVLVNNAGGLVERQAADALQWDLMEKIFALNTFSAMKIASLCIPLLRKSTTDPNIINLSSIVVRHGGPSAVLYAASKGAIDVFTRGLSRELAPTIRANSVAPGVIDTPFHEKVSTPELMKNWAANNPLKHNGEPRNIALAIKMLSENDFINGESIDVNGGLYIR